VNIIPFPRVRLGLFPTPLQEMKCLTKKLRGPRLFVKRDDLSGFLLGGNKTRKLEFLIPDIIKKDADIVITTGGVQSNWAAQLSTAARNINVEVLLVLRGMKPKNLQGNYLLDRILGAKIEFVNISMDEYRRNITEIMEEIAEDHRKRGKRPYVLPLGGSIPLADLGWVNGAFELINQANEQDLKIDYVVVAGGSLGTVSGLATGFKACNSSVKTICVSVLSNNKDECRSKISSFSQQTANLMKLDFQIDESEVDIFVDYVGAGYAERTNSSIEAIKLLAQTEGIVLDPVYTGKAMAVLIDLVKKEVLTRDSNVVFLHTGGAPSLFGYANYFSGAGFGVFREKLVQSFSQNTRGGAK